MNTNKTIDLLKEQIAKASSIRQSQDISSQLPIWDQTNMRLLKSMFDGATVSLYSEIRYSRVVRSDGDLFRAHRELLDKKTRMLQEILAEHERFAAVDPGLAGVGGKGAAQSRTEGDRGLGKKVFIVHGRDQGTKEAVARYVQDLGLDPIILHERPNLGRTIIEKFEGESEVTFAIALFTPDDVGALKEEAKALRPRARQNVVLEFGFFLGRLSRSRACALIKGELERPSDYDGVVFIPFDEHGAWQLLLGREMKAAGMDVDLNRLA